MFRFLHRLLARIQTPLTEENVAGSAMADAKSYAQARDLSPPPPSGGGGS